MNSRRGSTSSPSRSQRVPLDNQISVLNCLFRREMTGNRMMPTRRRFLQCTVAAAAAATTLPKMAQGQANRPAARTIPSSGEAITAVGLGTWITFNVGDDPVLRDECADVMAAFFESGGRMIDCSPMYGSSQPVIGYGLEKLGRPEALFSAEKVWTSSAEGGPAQIERSRRLWGVPHFDLLQVHNLVAWEAHLRTLFDMKAAGRLRYVGITTSEGRRHGLFEEIMRSHPLDFVQFTYNIVDREAEERLLPLAADRGMAVIVNRPFQQGSLTTRLEGESLPDWASEIGATSWAQFILKFILSHPAVTVAIPATTRVDHVRENLAAASGLLPDAALRERMAAYVGDV
jgi:diketogulonate reductase-like aldo/keto reductase